MPEYCPQSSEAKRFLSAVSEALYRADQAIEIANLAIRNGQLCKWIEVVIGNQKYNPRIEAAKKILSLIESGGGIGENVSRPFCLRIIHNEFLELQVKCRQLVSDLLLNLSTSDDEDHALRVFFPEISKKISSTGELAA